MIVKENTKPLDVDGDGCRPIPVTILSGFLGSGKTTLLKHILETNEHKKRIAVIVNDMAELNIDASLLGTSGLLQTPQQMVSLQNGCICCTLRTDLIQAINEIRDTGLYEYVVIESTGLAEPQQVAESFVFDPDTAEVADDPSKMLWNVARLDTCVTVVDLHSFEQSIRSLQAYKDVFPMDGINSTSGQIDKNSSKDPKRFPNGNPHSREHPHAVVGAENNHDEEAEGEKNIAHLMVEQVEFANIILLNKTDLVSSAAIQTTKALIKSLNPIAKIIQTSYGRIDDLNEVLNTNLFDLEKARSSPGWLVSLSSSTNSHKSESEEYGVTSFVYRARKPFHPYRLHTFVNQIFYYSSDWEGRYKTLTQEHCFKKRKMENPEDPFSPLGTDERFNYMASKYGTILRSKGYAWVAGRDKVMGFWAQTGRLLTLSPGPGWYVDIPKDEWVPENHDVATRKPRTTDATTTNYDAVEDDESSEKKANAVTQEIEAKFVAPYGDRRQEIVFIGIGLYPDALTSALDQCLLTDNELKHQHDMYHSVGRYHDPLPPWNDSIDCRSTGNVGTKSSYCTVLRLGQVTKFVVQPGTELFLQNVSLNLHVENVEWNENGSNGDMVLQTNFDESKTRIRVWLDSYDGKQSILLCTFRPNGVEQQPISITLQSSISNGTDHDYDEECIYTLRTEDLSTDSIWCCPHDIRGGSNGNKNAVYLRYEVHVIGIVLDAGGETTGGCNSDDHEDDETH